MAFSMERFTRDKWHSLHHITVSILRCNFYWISNDWLRRYCESNSRMRGKKSSFAVLLLFQECWPTQATYGGLSLTLLYN